MNEGLPLFVTTCGIFIGRRIGDSYGWPAAKDDDRRCRLCFVARGGRRGR